MVVVKDLANRAVPTPEAGFRIARSNIVWRSARWGRRPAHGARKVHLERMQVGNDWSVDPEERVLVLRNGEWIDYAADAANAGVNLKAVGNADAEAHRKHEMCGGVRVANDTVHMLRHARRNVGCGACRNYVTIQEAAERKAERTVQPVEMAGPEVAEMVACGHDGAQIARAIRIWTQDCDRASAQIGNVTFRRLGRGVSRVAVDAGCGKHVVKIEYGAGWLGKQAKSEVEAFLKAKPEMKQDLARIFAWSADFRAVVVEKCFLQQPDVMSALRARAGKYGIGDLHGKNVGWRPNGQPVILDYGL